MVQNYILGIPFAHSQSEVSREPVQLTAQETIDSLSSDESNIADEIYTAANEISKVIDIAREENGSTVGILEILTAQQLQEIRDRMHGYLGTDLETHLKTLSAPTGFALFVGRLATHFSASDTSVASQFGSFELRHINPEVGAIGPREDNSRQHANTANELLLRQFDEHYQANLKISLRGPSKRTEGGSLAWERGIAECQFLALDYIRDQFIYGRTSPSLPGEKAPMTIIDIENNITNIINNRSTLIKDITVISPMIASELEQAIGTVLGFTVESYHRGRTDIPRYKSNPNGARRAILQVERLLMRAAKLAEIRPDQEEIPILDI